VAEKKSIAIPEQPQDEITWYDWQKVKTLKMPNEAAKAGGARPEEESTKPRSQRKRCAVAGDCVTLRTRV
jgi:hypothetical protein